MKTILINNGHGGMVEGKYVTAPDKMYDHGNGHKVYEGVINREIARRTIRYLQLYGMQYVDICASNLDVPLYLRLNIINSYCNLYGAQNCLLIDLHSNAGGGEGFEIWTSPGNTRSDIYAKEFFERFKDTFPEVKMRSEKTPYNPGPDKEALFTLISKSYCDAILPEFLFFDNLKEYIMLTSYYVQDKYARMIADFCYSIRND
jgi:N-acetylmuramoyl-L-alanine amidase